MDKISFTSYIRPVNTATFERVISGIGQRKKAGYPWTVKQMVKASEAYTTDILDCTVCGLTNGKDVVLLHICPTAKENKNFPEIEKAIKDAIDLKDPDIQGIILGARSYSKTLYNKFVKFMEKHNIPYSQFFGGDTINSVAYQAKNDEWLISNTWIDTCIKKGAQYSKGALSRSFDEIKLSKLDEII